MNFKGKFPFRIGCTSYVIPDDILPNVAFMADKVDDIELVLFESNEWSNLPDISTVSSMQDIANKYDITYSIHFPIDCRAGVDNPQEREKFYTRVTDIIRLTEELPISGYLLHLEGLKSENDHVEVQRWKKVTDTLCDTLISSQNINPNLICIENLGYNPRLHMQHIVRYQFSHCIDLGHLWMYGSDWLQYCNQVIENTRIIHLHGVVEGKDHCSLRKHTQKIQLQELKSVLRNYTGVVTMEVFNNDDTFSSLSHFLTFALS